MKTCFSATSFPVFRWSLRRAAAKAKFAGLSGTVFCSSRLMATPTTVRARRTVEIQLYLRVKPDRPHISPHPRPIPSSQSQGHRRMVLPPSEIASIFTAVQCQATHSDSLQVAKRKDTLQMSPSFLTLCTTWKRLIHKCPEMALMHAATTGHDTALYTQRRSFAQEPSGLAFTRDLPPLHDTLCTVLSHVLLDTHVVLQNVCMRKRP